MVSHSYWQSKLGSRELDANTKLIVNGAPAQVVGVTPPSFFGLAVGEGFDIVRPMCQPQQLLRNLFDVTVMGRLRRGITLSQATAQLTGTSPAIMAATEIRGYDANVVSEYLQFKLAAYSAATGVSYLRDSYDWSLQLLLGYHRSCPADCLREPGEFDAREGHCARTRNRGAPGFGRWAYSLAAPVAGGKQPAGRHWRGVGCGTGARAEPCPSAGAFYWGQRGDALHEYGSAGIGIRGSGSHVDLFTFRHDANVSSIRR
jgi:hypothetical protein